VALVVEASRTPGFAKRGVIADASEDIEQFTLRGDRVGWARCATMPRPRRRARSTQRLIFGFLFAMVVALEFGIEMMAAVDFEQSLVGWRVRQTSPERTRRVRRAWPRLRPLGRAASCG
jgi:hypothetical protein